MLLAEVIARFLFGRPLGWADEVAATVFLWFAMASVVLADCSRKHMRILLLLLGVPRVGGVAEAVSKSVAFAGFLALAAFSLDYAVAQADLTSSTLAINGAWRAAALPLGFGMLALLAALRLAADPAAWPAAVLVAAVMALLWWLSPALADMDNGNLVPFFVVILGACLTLAVPIGLSFAVATMSYLAFCTDIPLSVVVGRLDEGISHYVLIAVPLFVFLGRLMEETRLAAAIVALLVAFLGRVRGGLSYVLVAAMFIVSGISGSKIADMAAVGPALFPEMKRRGARPGELVALLASSGAMSEAIPPSLVLITTGVAAGVSIAALFTAGLLPSLLLAACLCLAVWFRSRGAAPADTPPVSARALWSAAMFALPGLALPVLVRTAVVEGIATATEVSSIGIAYTMLAGLTLYRPFPWRRLPAMLVDTATLSGAILFIIGAATAMAWALTQSGLSQDIFELVVRIPGGGAGFMAMSVVFFIVLGSLLEGVPAILIFAPLLFPTAARTGIDPVHYAIVAVLSMGVGLFIPPFGLGYWSACAIGNVEPELGIRPLIPYLVALLVGLGIVAAAPIISTAFLG